MSCWIGSWLLCCMLCSWKVKWGWRIKGCIVGILFVYFTPLWYKDNTKFYQGIHSAVFVFSNLKLDSFFPLLLFGFHGAVSPNSMILETYSNQMTSVLYLACIRAGMFPRKPKTLPLGQGPGWNSSPWKCLLKVPWSGKCWTIIQRRLNHSSETINCCEGLGLSKLT